MHCHHIQIGDGHGELGVPIPDTASDRSALPLSLSDAVSAYQQDDPWEWLRTIRINTDAAA
jgi:hypothetical protein